MRGFGDARRDDCSILVIKNVMLPAVARSPFFPAAAAEPMFVAPTPIAGKKKLTIAEKQRDDAWRVHIGSNFKVATCMFCCVNQLNYKEKSSWQASHIVPEKWDVHHQPMDGGLYLVPSCAACNASVATSNALDYLFDNFKSTSLKTICFNIFKAFCERHEGADIHFDNCCWKLIRKLFGSDSHAAGGGITCINEPSIYQLLVNHQLQMLQNDIVGLMKQVSEKTRIMENLATETYRSSKRPRQFA